jgi:hypothetical protein
VEVPEVKFKTPDRMVKEFFEVVQPKLRMILTDVDYWMLKKGQEALVTDLFRRPDEQKELYLAGLSKQNSVHELGRGADLRIVPELWKELESYVNGKYPYHTIRPWLKTIIQHGKPEHWHIQTYE